MSAVEVSDLTVVRGEVTALAEVSLAVDRGRVCGLLGANGSGKTTLLRALLGDLPAASGSALVQGMTPREARRRAAVGYVPQDDAVDRGFPITVEQVVLTGRRRSTGLLGRPSATDRGAVSEALERVDMTALRGRTIGELSGGQRKRVLVARCLAQGAGVLLLDEPFAGVDAESEATVVAVIRELAAEGVATLVATHHLDGVASLCDDVVVLSAGRVAHTGVVDDDTAATAAMAALRRPAVRTDVEEAVR